MDLKHKKVLVVGGGKSGIAAVGLLTKMGAESILFDSKKGITAEELREKLPEGYKAVCYGETLPEDVEKDAEAEMQKIHDKYIKKVDELYAAKEKEIMTV